MSIWWADVPTGADSTEPAGPVIAPGAASPFCATAVAALLDKWRQSGGDFFEKHPLFSALDRSVSVTVKVSSNVVDNVRKAGSCNGHVSLRCNHVASPAQRKTACFLLFPSPASRPDVNMRREFGRRLFVCAAQANSPIGIVVDSLRVVLRLELGLESFSVSRHASLSRRGYV